MKKSFYYLVASIVMIAGLITSLRYLEAEDATAGDKVPDQYIVVFKDQVADADVTTNELVKKHGLKHLQTYRHVLSGFAARIPASRLKALKDDPRVAFISEDRIVTAFDQGEAMGPKKNSRPVPPAQKLPTGIDRINAENKINNGTGINVAIIDTGIDYTHPDLAANVVGGINCTTVKGGYTDGNGHGTHVAGIVAALNNSIGVVGVAPEAKLWAVRVLNNAGSGTWSSIICGIDFVTSKAPRNGGPITVANMSLGGKGVSDNDCGNTNSDALHQAICRSRDAGVTYVVAAGNSSVDAATSVPAAYDDAVITVSALADSDGNPGGLGAPTTAGPDDTFATFSNYGSVVDLGAPGVSILSTWKGGGYSTISGTSMASPHVAGAAALYLATHSGASWAVVRDALKTSGEPVGADHSDPTGLHPEPVVRADSL